MGSVILSACSICTSCDDPSCTCSCVSVCFSGCIVSSSIVVDCSFVLSCCVLIRYLSRFCCLCPIFTITGFLNLGSSIINFSTEDISCGCDVAASMQASFSVCNKMCWPSGDLI